MTKFSKHTLTGDISSIFMLVFFTIFWAFFIPFGFGWTTIPIICFTIFFVYGIYLFINAVKLKKLVGALPDSPTNAAEKQTDKIFRIIFIIEIVLIAASSAILSIIGYSSYINPIIALIVGAHLIPLSLFVFHTKRSIFGGIILMIAAIAAIIFIYFGQWAKQATGGCSFIAALGIARYAAYLLNLVKSSLKTEG